MYVCIYWTSILSINFCYNGSFRYCCLLDRNIQPHPLLHWDFSWFSVLLVANSTDQLNVEWRIFLPSLSSCIGSPSGSQILLFGFPVLYYSFSLYPFFHKCTWASCLFSLCVIKVNYDKLLTVWHLASHTDSTMKMLASSMVVYQLLYLWFSIDILALALMWHTKNVSKKVLVVNVFNK